MGFNDPSYKRKPQSHSSILTCAGAIQLVERFKDVFQPIGWNTDPCICDRDNDKIFPLTLNADHHASTQRCELDSVIDKLAQHPGNLLCIRLDRGHILVDHRV